jgi:hypothetical protein
MLLLKQTIVGIIVNAVIIAVLGGLGMFVWNTGACGLIPTLAPITFSTSFAIMLGIWMINLFCKSWYNRITAKRNEKLMMEKLFGKKHINKK